MSVLTAWHVKMAPRFSRYNGGRINRFSITSPKLCSYWSSTTSPLISHRTAGCGRPASKNKTWVQWMSKRGVTEWIFKWMEDRPAVAVAVWPLFVQNIFCVSVRSVGGCVFDDPGNMSRFINFTLAGGQWNYISDSGHVLPYWCLGRRRRMRQTHWLEVSVAASEEND